ncbi:MAG: bifunctional oligoribonuclease/PAP phosphatase NrnA [Aerococcus sp.]|nr:bifunctional oligoribonuclease/PAP phosphatase NrnA [Aerococcus sp.]
MFKDILEAIEANDTIIIHRHIHPDPDAVGSQLGLRDSLRATYPDKKIYAVGFDEPTLAYIGTMDQISDDTYKDALVIVNDTADTPRIDDQRFNTGKQLIKVDHHPNRDSYGDLLYVDEDASSVSEIWAQVILSDDNKLTLTDDSAKALFLGIVGDTGRFLFDSTTPDTMRVAGELMRYNFPASELMQQANTQTVAQAKLQGYVLEQMVVSADGLVSSVTISQSLMQQLNLTEAETHKIVQIPGSIKGVVAWVIFVEREGGEHRVHFRSKGPAINEIAENHHGGGHAKASGGTSYSAEEREAIITEVDHASQLFKQEREAQGNYPF